MMQGASTPPPQLTPEARMVAEQQSVAPLVKGIPPQPTPPQTPSQASAQHTVPSWTPASPLGQVDAVTSKRDRKKGGRGEDGGGGGAFKGAILEKGKKKKGGGGGGGGGGGAFNET